ncbi:D-threitol dehydrogenase [Cellvibrio zantedeschiae]|uniref:D-threitol dehydrogenase n=1 Tax=Cellvibrio zantedeschiae TaxID=1237077 RepID=A0ABQ3ANQ1_9GAMM|nr:SDR family oxidoreductase [Cellvibrio zantedeschiae]GGY61939.1 D-threitol dehydrogenase [Cellvibrio zantedeschiae]
MPQAFNMKDKVIVITGASRGIGRGLATYFAEQGAHVVALARNLEQLKALQTEILANGGACSCHPLDVRDVPSIQGVFDSIVAELGRIDILINNAGMGKPIPAIDITESDWDEMMSLNMKGTFFCAQAAARHMLPKQYGRIVNISSQAAVIAIDGEAIYCSSKGGINQLTKVLALEWSKQGVTVNAVGPTFTYTPGTAERLDNPEFRAGVLANIPRGRIGSIEDIATAVQFLAADSSDMVNGAFLLTDGGWTII